MEGEIIGNLEMMDSDGFCFTDSAFLELFKRFVEKQVGKNFRIVSHGGLYSFSGKKLVSEKNGKVITFVTVQPRNNPKNIVHIVREESPVNEGSIVDIINHGRGTKKESTIKPEQLSKLEELKNKLQEQEK